MIDNLQDTIDSRDIISRIDELEDIIDNTISLEYDCEEEIQELKSLKALADQACDSPDWKYGEVLIRKNYFEDYARELAEDIGAVSGDEKWPLNHIDWESAAEELANDYFEVDFDGVPYYIRA